MKNSQLHLYSIIPLDIAHLEEICDDIFEQYESGVTTCALFSMTLVPTGNPVVDKVNVFCEKYRMFKSKLDTKNIPTGVLVQASIGHGYLLGEKFPYQSYVNFTDGKEIDVVCPYDQGFKDYIYNVMKTIAMTNPSCIMVDDDYRLIQRPGLACACPLHMKRFNEIAKTNLTREELVNIVNSKDTKAKEYSEILYETQRESLVETAKIMRLGIDSVNPKLPASFCTCGHNADFAEEIAKALSGELNPSIVRINNGRYAIIGSQFFSHAFYRASTQIALLKDKVDVILAETDTCPHNRYSTNACSLHAHFTGTIIEGAIGAKHWLTRLPAFEPQSGKAYRKVLAKYRNFYQAIADITPELKWRGARIYLPKTFEKKIGKEFLECDGWGNYLFERLGIPFYYSVENSGVLCMEGTAIKEFSDEQIIELLKGKLILASDSAEILVERGFGKYLGVDVRTWKGKRISGEYLCSNGNKISKQSKMKELVPLNDNLIVDSYIYNTVDRVNFEKLFPASTIFDNEIGGRVITFCGTPVSNFNYYEGFAFLNYSRKQQLIKMFADMGELPVYYYGDEEVYLRVADMKNGDTFVALFNIGLDEIEKIELYIERKVNKIYSLNADGKKDIISFSYDGEKYTLNNGAKTLMPEIFIIS